MSVAIDLTRSFMPLAAPAVHRCLEIPDGLDVEASLIGEWRESTGIPLMTVRDTLRDGLTGYQPEVGIYKWAENAPFTLAINSADFAFTFNFDPSPSQRKISEGKMKVEPRMRGRGIARILLGNELMLARLSDHVIDQIVFKAGDSLGAFEWMKVLPKISAEDIQNLADEMKMGLSFLQEHIPDARYRQISSLLKLKNGIHDLYEILSFREDLNSLRDLFAHTLAPTRMLPFADENLEDVMGQTLRLNKFLYAFLSYTASIPLNDMPMLQRIETISGVPVVSGLAERRARMQALKL